MIRLCRNPTKTITSRPIVRKQTSWPGSLSLRHSLQQEAFHMKYQRQITKIRWKDHTRNSEVAARTGLDSRSGVGSHHTPPELRLRSHCQASWRHASPPSTPVSCRSDSRPSSWPKLEASPRPSQQPMDWKATQGQQQNATSWPMEKIHHTWSLEWSLRSSTTTRWRRRRCHSCCAWRLLIVDVFLNNNHTRRHKTLAR